MSRVRDLSGPQLCFKFEPCAAGPYEAVAATYITEMQEISVSTNKFFSFSIVICGEVSEGGAAGLR